MIGVIGPHDSVELTAQVAAEFGLQDSVLTRAYEVADEAQVRRLEAERSCDFSHLIPEVARFRVNVFHEKGNLCIVARCIPLRIKSAAELSLPAVLEEIADLRRLEDQESLLKEAEAALADLEARLQEALAGRARAEARCGQLEADVERLSQAGEALEALEALMRQGR